MGKSKTQQLAALSGMIMLHLVQLEAIIITLAALLPEEQLEHVQAAMDRAAETEGFRRVDRQTLSAIADGLMQQILDRTEELQEE